MTKRMTEDAFLEDRIGRAVVIYLITGIKLLGTLDDHDCDVVFLLPHGGRVDDIQMISKQAISTMMLGPSNQSQVRRADASEGVLAGRRWISRGGRRHKQD